MLRETSHLNRYRFQDSRAGCSFYDDEEICRHDEYLGIRAERGLFKTKDGSVISRLMNSGVTIPLRRLVL